MRGGHVFQFCVLIRLNIFLCFMCVGIPTYMGHFVSFTQHIGQSQRLTPIQFEDHKYLQHISLLNAEKVIIFEKNLFSWKTPDMCGNYTTCVVFTTHLQHVELCWKITYLWEIPHICGKIHIHLDLPNLCGDSLTSVVFIT